MHRLSGTDTNHLRMETPEQPMTACGMFMLDTSTMPSGYSFEAFRDKLSGQIAALPEFRMKLADSALNLDNPVWVDDPSFELDHHLHRVELPAAGGPRELRNRPPVWSQSGWIATDRSGTCGWSRASSMPIRA